MQKETFISYYDKAEGGYFQLIVNNKVVIQQTKNDDKQAGRQQLEEAFDQLISQGDKIELKVATASNLTKSVSLLKYMTPSGQFEKSSMQVPSQIGNSSDLLTWFKMGYDQGYTAGKNDTRLENILEQNANPQSRFDLGTLAENLSGTEQGQAMLAALMSKFGLL